MADAFIVSAVRTPVGQGAERRAAPHAAGRDGRGRHQGSARARARRSTPAEIEDVILGCAMPEAEQGLNVARIASLRAGVPITASAVTVNRFCSSGLQAIAYGAERIMTGAAHAIVAGGTESMSMVPMGGNKIAPNPALVDTYPDVYLTTGPGRREPRARLRDLARGAGRVRAPQPPARRCGDRRRPISPTRPSPVGPTFDRGRRAATRHVARGAGEAEAGVPREGHGHRRQFVADERRRVRGRGHERRAGARSSG